MKPYTKAVPETQLRFIETSEGEHVLQQLFTVFSYSADHVPTGNPKTEWRDVPLVKEGNA